MPKSATSQWDFSGELFPPQVSRRVFTVRELTIDIRRLLEKQFGQIWVAGEITNCRVQSSGHIYFTLKDAAAQISCVLFRGDPVAERAALQDGRQVILKGELTVYEPRGQYQLRVLVVELQGVGALQAAFEKLKLKLAAEGLFASERKRPLPRFPRRIGLATSPTGAAIRDVLHVLQRRHPGLEIILAPCAVQGGGAAAEIAASIALLNQWSLRPSGKLDIILVTRGGGSLEDLWAFNEEAVARAIFQSVVPVISAVGHEIDFTISDFVADFRAATPSAAAEILTEAVFASGKWAVEAQGRMQETVRRRLNAEQRHWRQLGQRLLALHPRRQLNQRLQRLDELQTMIARGARRSLQQMRLTAQTLLSRLSRMRPAQALAQRGELLRHAERRLREQANRQILARRQHCAALAARLRLLGPEQVLTRGYSITLDDASGAIIRSAVGTQPGQKLRTRLKAGEVRSTVS